MNSRHTIAAALTAAALALTSCHTTRRTAETYSARHVAETSAAARTDTAATHSAAISREVIRDSVLIMQRGDTVVKEVYRDRLHLIGGFTTSYRAAAQSDTVRVTVTDTVRVQTAEVRERRPGLLTTARTAAIAAAATAAVIFTLWVRRKTG